MSWGEAWRLFLILGADPSSQVASAIAGWQYPSSREELALATLVDQMGKAHFKKPHNPYPRPWDEPPKRVGTGRRTVAGWKKWKADKQAEYTRRRNG